MFDYYTSIIIICILGLLVLGVLVFENNRIAKKDKKIFYIGYAIIALSALAEWGGVKMSGNPNVPTVLLRLVKTIDYILTPMAGIAIVAQMKPKNIWFRILLIVLSINIVFQIVSAFTGWMIEIKENNVYVHGMLYYVYIGLYAAILLLAVVEFIIYGNSFKKRNRLSLYSFMALVIFAIAIQEAKGFRTAYLGIVFGAAMMFIHFAEFGQVRSDEKIHEQEIQITTDQLTGLLNRYAYSKMLEEYSNPPLPEDLVVFLIDINGLKATNDKYGHNAGDELICGAAECIKDSVDGRANIFRIGGDEFVVFTHMNKDAVYRFIHDLEEKTSKWSGSKVHELSVASGYALASEKPSLSAEQLAREADKSMYRAKSLYYSQKGIDRRVS